MGFLGMSAHPANGSLVRRDNVGGDGRGGDAPNYLRRGCRGKEARSTRLRLSGVCECVGVFISQVQRKTRRRQPRRRHKSLQQRKALSAATEGEPERAAAEPLEQTRTPSTWRGQDALGRARRGMRCYAVSSRWRLEGRGGGDFAQHGSGGIPLRGAVTWWLRRDMIRKEKKKK